MSDLKPSNANPMFEPDAWWDYSLEQAQEYIADLRKQHPGTWTALGRCAEQMTELAAAKTDEAAHLAKDLGEAKAKLRHVCEIMATLNEPGLKDVLLEMHAYLFPEATAVRITATEKKP